MADISDDEVLEKPKRTKKVKEIKEIPTPITLEIKEKKGRGRPKKIVQHEQESEPEEEVVEPVKKTRGRPKKVVEPEYESSEEEAVEVIEPVKKSRKPKAEAPVAPVAPVAPEPNMLDVFSRLLKESEDRMIKLYKSRPSEPKVKKEKVEAPVKHIPPQAPPTRAVAKPRIGLLVV